MTSAEAQRAVEDLLATYPAGRHREALQTIIHDALQDVLIREGEAAMLAVVRDTIERMRGAA